MWRNKKKIKFEYMFEFQYIYLVIIKKNIYIFKIFVQKTEKKWPKNNGSKHVYIKKNI